MSTKPKRGVRRTHHRNGLLAVEEIFSGQKLHGRRRTWHRNGQLATEEHYRDGRLHGLSRQWSEKGRLLGSFRMQHGTGLQKSWHDNGRLNLEFSTVEGQFCGRSRLWLSDGTLVSDKILLFNRNVPPARYRQAAAKDTRLPKLRGRIGKSPAHNRALELHTYRIFVSRLLKKRPCTEARAWLNAGNNTSRSLGRFKQANAAKFVVALYQVGAVKVIVPDIYRNKRGDQFADWMLVQLPKEARKRKAIRAVCAQLRKGDLGAVQPDQDWGESYLSLLLA